MSIRTNTTTLDPNAPEEENRLRLVLAMVEAAGFTPCYATSRFRGGVAFAFSDEMVGYGTTSTPAYSVTLHADGRLT